MICLSWTTEAGAVEQMPFDSGRSSIDELTVRLTQAIARWPDRSHTFAVTYIPDAPEHVETDTNIRRREDRDEKGA
jgi:hypothetical protein